MSFGQYSAYGRPKSDIPSFPAKTVKEKHIVSNPAHIFAHPFDAKTGTGFKHEWATNSTKNWYFRTFEETRVCFSYRDSYPLASRFELGKKTVFFMRPGPYYSVTTSGQANATRGAIPKNEENVLLFDVPNLTGPYFAKPGKKEHESNLAYFVEQCQEAIEAHTKARSSYNLKQTLQAATQARDSAKLYARVFKLRVPVFPKLPKLDAAKLADIIKREQAREVKQDVKRALERAEYERHHQEEVNAWLASDKACIHIVDGRPVHSFSDRYTCERQTEREQWEANRESLILQWRQGANVTLRIGYSEPALLRVKDGNVETSQGVDVPISGRLGAARLFRFLLNLKQTDRTFETNGHKEHIGNFSVTSFKPAILTPSSTDDTKPEWILTAGCHRITWDEIVSISDAVLAVEQAETDKANLDGIAYA